MGRHERRASVARFKREASGGGGLLTFLIAADDVAALDGQPLLRHAAQWWRNNIMRRRPVCCECKASFADGARPGAFLFSTAPDKPTSASVSVFCARCFRDLPDDEFERAAMRVLRRVLPNGKFEGTSS